MDRMPVIPHSKPIRKPGTGQGGFWRLLWYLLVCAAGIAHAQTGTDLVLVQIPAAAVTLSVPEAPALSPWDRYVEGARIVTSSPGAAPGAVKNLTPDFAAACDPDVSFDGQTILFAGKQHPDDAWQIWQMNRDGSGKTQITSGPGDHVAPVHAGNRFYLNDPQPTPQIIYVGTEHGWLDKQGAAPVPALYGTDFANDTTYHLTYNLSGDFAPDVLPNGRIVFSSRQQYGNRYRPTGLVALMAINNDGTDLMPYYGNHEQPALKEMVSVAEDGDRVYFIESDGTVPLGGGDLAFVSRRRPLHSYQKLKHGKNGLFHSPCPLPDGGLIASFRADQPDAVFGLYRISPDDGKRLDRIYAEPGWHSIDAQVLAAHPRVKGRSDWLVPGATTGVFYCLNSYRTNLPVEADIAQGEIKYVRVIEGLPMSAKPGVSLGRAHATGAPDPVVITGTDFSPARILGLAPVEKDGSFQVKVPANIPITFQLLDAEYLALRTQQAWTWVMGNENRGCIGCHEDRELAPPNRMVDAVIKPPVDLTLPPAKRRLTDFRHQIAPLIDARCATAGCHVAGGAVPNLEDPAAPQSGSGFSAAYTALISPIPDRHNERYVVPGAARKSPLIWHLFGRQLVSNGPDDRHNITQMPPENLLPAAERILITEWIDLGAQWDSGIAITSDAPER